MTTLTNQNGCDSILVEYVNYEATPPLEVEDIEICEGETVTLTVSGGNGNYTWSSTESMSCLDCSNPLVSPETTATYTVSTTSCNGTEQATITVTVIPNPIITVGQEKERIKLGDSVKLWANTNQVLSNLSWFTSEGEVICVNCSEITVNPSITSNYIVTAINEIGCEVSEMVSVAVNQACPDATVDVPNMFTPNNDGVNDVFDFNYTGLEEVTLLRIYNRWGQKVFETNDLGFKWDGTFRNLPVDPGVFVYYFEAICPNGKKVVYQGNITVIR